MDDDEFHGNFAENYDVMADQFRSLGGQVMFGLHFDHISPGERIIDIGIGTGLGSFRYHRFGLEVYGVDISKRMLEECERKGFARELRALDITSESLPYPDAHFEHAICHGVLHFFGDLSGIFKEAVRVIRPGGTFAFNTMCYPNGGPLGEEVMRKDTRWGKKVSYHGKGYIREISNLHGLEELASLLYVGGIDTETDERYFNRAYLMRFSGKLKGTDPA